jgi:hypothetical protein
LTDPGEHAKEKRSVSSFAKAQSDISL